MYRYRNVPVRMYPSPGRNVPLPRLVSPRQVSGKTVAGADPGFLKWGGGEGGVQSRSTSKKGGGARRGSNFGTNVKKPTSWQKGGVRTPWTPPPPLDPLLRGKVYIESGCRLCRPSRQLHRRSARGSRSAGSGGRGSTHPPSGVLGVFFLVAWNPPPFPGNNMITWEFDVQ